MVSSSRAASLLSGLLPRAGRAAASALASSSVASSSSSSSAVIGVAPIAAAAASASRFFSSGVPMTEPLHGLVLPTPASSSSAPAPATQLTTLPNGAKIASEDTAGPTATLGIYVDSGSVYETAETTGASHLLEYLAFKATQHRTHFRLVREVEAIGANVLASASREQMAYAVDVARPLVPEALELLSDAVLNPKFEAWEVEAAAQRLAADAAAMKEGNPQGGLLEALHEVAYTGALARPLLAPTEVLSRLAPEALSRFVAENFAPPRVVLAAAGVGHSELVNLAAPLLESSSSSSSSSSSASPVRAPESKYVGGDCRQFSASGVTHLMLGFEAAGGWRDVPGSVAVTVLQFLLGGGGSFSAGGPGKGMHSRLYSRVLAKHGWVRTCAAFSSLYNDTGLVGVYAAADSSNAAQLVDVVSEELRELASKPVPAAELERAKAAALSSVLMNLESRAVVAEDIGRQVLTYGTRKPVSEFVDAIKALTPASMCAAVKKATATPLSMAALGDIAALPRYSEVAARFK